MAATTSARLTAAVGCPQFRQCLLTTFIKKGHRKGRHQLDLTQLIRPSPGRGPPQESGDSRRAERELSTAANDGSIPFGPLYLG
jgi:hypothetical protein